VQNKRVISDEHPDALQTYKWISGSGVCVSVQNDRRLTICEMVKRQEFCVASVKTF
jgi:hypothetical protein